jgi:hypothetical protein
VVDEIGREQRLGGGLIPGGLILVDKTVDYGSCVAHGVIAAQAPLFGMISDAMAAFYTDRRWSDAA